MEGHPRTPNSEPPEDLRRFHDDTEPGMPSLEVGWHQCHLKVEEDMCLKVVLVDVNMSCIYIYTCICIHTPYIYIHMLHTYIYICYRLIIEIYIVFTCYILYFVYRTLYILWIYQKFHI